MPEGDKRISRCTLYAALGPSSHADSFTLTRLTDKGFENVKDAKAWASGKLTNAMLNGEERFYAVARGHKPGIYNDWSVAQPQIAGFKGPKFQRCDTHAEAVEYIRVHGSQAAQAALAKEEGLEPPAKKGKSSSKKAVLNDDDPDVLEVYTDGASRGNGRAGAVAGYGVFFGEGDERNVSERLRDGEPTNNRAELTAILRTLEIVPIDQKLRICCDSQYSLSCITDWYKKWMANNWKKSSDGQKVQNQDLIKAIREIIDEREGAGMETLFQKVAGHAEIPGNVAADKLAVAGALKR
ncbi:ribonuclease H-like protein [Xylariaceae sp. FL0804]|nr:ribonuclease H-like protein [Xylariaceae sp. FL0804]